jgi:hypothetical protein
VFSVRQATGLQGRNFQATSNIRNETMMKEASEFAAHLRRCEKAITDMKNAADSVLSTSKSTMSAPLPHVFEDTAAGSGGDVRQSLSIGGTAFQGDVVARISQTSSAQIESQVLVPMKRWLEVYSALQVRLKEVEALRLEVDSRRHTVIDLAASVDKQRAKLSKMNGSDYRVEAALDETIKKLQHKEGKLAVAVQSFNEKEQALYTDLSTLIKDATWLRHYVASALRLQGEALLNASKALGDSRALESAATMDMASLSLGASSPETVSRGTTPTPSLDLPPEGLAPAAFIPSSSITSGSLIPPASVAPSSSHLGADNPFISSGVI